ncbi:MAG: type II toxin-antitoxin system HicA family toxin, partial [Flavobacteriaceae bacterium]|nr:type II toxin-antitoxin system HicA family toxin [Flavobacteriaceae bacterium]
LKLLNQPSDLTWIELIKVLKHFCHSEFKSKGKTGGSRRKFVNKNKGVIILHEPHPGSIVKNYVFKQIIEKLKLRENE